MREKNYFSMNIQWDSQVWRVALKIYWSKIAVIQRMRLLALLKWLDCFPFSQCPWNQILWLSVLSSLWQSPTVTGKYLNNIGSDGPPVLRSILDKTRCILPEISCKPFYNIWFEMLACCEGARKSRVSCDLLGCHWVSLPCWMDPDNSLHYLQLACLCVGWTFLILKWCRTQFSEGLSQVLACEVVSWAEEPFHRAVHKVGVGTSLAWKQFPICSLDVTWGWDLD